MISIKRWMWSGQEKITLEIQIPAPEELLEGDSDAAYFIQGTRVTDVVFSDVVSMLAVPK